jgi:dTDP-4-dehydrorhamnose reductase
VRTLVTGAAGLLGHTLMRVVAEHPDVEAVGGVRRPSQRDVLRHAGHRVELVDIADEGSVTRVLAAGIDVVINCAGMTKARSGDAVEAMRVNALGPHLLARACERAGVRLVHMSTDCVFSGLTGRYTEDDLPDPVDLYGRSKLAGEVTDGPHLTVRTSFIGRELGTRHGLLEWFLAQRGRVSGYAGAIWSGLTAITLSRTLLALAARADVTGLLHVGGEAVDKYTLLTLLRDAFHKDDVDLVATDEPRVDRSLDCGRARSLGVGAPTLQEMIKELATER